MSYTPVKSGSFVLRNCFRKEPPCTQKPARVQPSTYFEENVSVDLFAGETRRIVERDYPVTAESVNSFVEMTDYKTNPAAFIPPERRGKNLGDIRDVESFANQDHVISDLTRQVAELKQLLNSKEKSQAEKASSSPAAEPTAAAASTSEVINNG